MWLITGTIESQMSRNVADSGLCMSVYVHMERSIRKWVLWISFYNIQFKSIYLPSY